MKLVLVVAAASLSMAAVAIAQVQPNDAAADHSVAAARQAHVQALKSKDPAKIAQSEAALRRAFEADAVDHQENARYAKLPKDGEARATGLALLQAQDSVQDAELAGDHAVLTKARANLRVAYAKNWAATHPKGAKK